MKRELITKDAPTGRQLSEVKFRPASKKELKQLGDDLPEGYIAGWASTPDRDFYDHVVMRGAFDKSIAAKGIVGPKGIKLLIGHERDKPAGRIKTLETRGEGLWLEAQLNLKISYVRDMYEAAKENEGFSFSVGFYLEDFEFVDEKNGDEYLLIKQGELEEISLVVFPGNENAVNTFIKGITDEEAFETLADMEKALVASNLVGSRNDAQKIIKLVKRNTPLFAPVAKPPVAIKPAISKEATKKLGDLLAELKTTLS